MRQKFLISSLLVVVVCGLSARVSGAGGGGGAGGGATGQADNDFFQKPGVEVVDILRARGYLAKNYEFITDDGYILTITRGTNPLINRGKSGLRDKAPILFIHGTFTNANEFVVHSFDAKPRDYTWIDVHQLTTHEAVDLLGADPSSNSLPMLAMNFGHEVWLLNRRGTKLSRRYTKRPLREGCLSPVEQVLGAYKEAGRWPLAEDEEAESRHADSELIPKNPLTEVVRVTINNPTREVKGKKSNSKLVPALKNAPAAFLNYFRADEEKRITRDKGYWNFSLDEQLAYDLPNAIDFVRFKTGQDRIAIVGHSGGAALVVLVHMMNPNLDQKLLKTIAWAPSVYLGKQSGVHGLAWLSPLLSSDGPMPGPLITFPAQAALQLVCGLELMQQTVCEFIGDLNLGPSGGQAPYRPEFMTTHFIPSSAKEAIQQLQFSRGGTRMYDYGSAELNLKAYGQVSPPNYEAGLIKSHHLSIWSSPHDRMITTHDIDLLTSKLKVPHKVFLVDQKGLKFNHGSYTWHRDVAKISVIPSFMDIVSVNDKIERLSRDEWDILRERFTESY